MAGCLTRLRPKWTISTLLLVVVWSSVVVSLNVRPRSFQLGRYPVVVRSNKGEEIVQMYHVAYGYPWICVSGNCVDSPDESEAEWVVLPDVIALHPPRSEYAIYYWALAGNAVVGLLVVAVLPFLSKYLLRRIISVLKCDNADEE